MFFTPPNNLLTYSLSLSPPLSLSGRESKTSSRPTRAPFPLIIYSTHPPKINMVYSVFIPYL